MERLAWCAACGDRAPSGGELGKLARCVEGVHRKNMAGKSVFARLDGVGWRGRANDRKSGGALEKERSRI